MVKLSMGKGSNSDFMVRQSETSNTLKAFGLNMDWDFNDDLNLNFDISYSQADSDPKAGMTDTVASRPSDYTYDRSSGSQLPVLSFDRNNSTSGLKAGWGDRSGTIVENEVFESKIDGIWLLDQGVLEKVGFGAMISDRTLSSRYQRTTRPLPWLWVDNSNAIMLPESLFNNFDANGFISGASGNPEQNWLSFDSECFFDYITSDEVIDMVDDPEQVRKLLADNDGHTMHQVPWTYEVNEQLKAIYADIALMAK